MQTIIPNANIDRGSHSFIVHVIFFLAQFRKNNYPILNSETRGFSEFSVSVYDNLREDTSRPVLILDFL